MKTCDLTVSRTIAGSPQEVFDVWLDPQKLASRQMTAGDGYLASNERLLIFGLGDAVHIDELEVRWPAGTRQRFFPQAI